MVIDFHMARSKLSSLSNNNLLAKKTSKEKDLIQDQFVRAEDIILGSLGFDGDATIVSISATESGFNGRGIYADGEEFVFENDQPLEQIEIWAFEILKNKFTGQAN
jgi:hypothetical protein